jgi:DNA-binding transcriptional LysR family regulator
MKMIQHPLTLDALRVLETIARRGSFAAAAEELHRVTSAVSYTVQKLEEDLDLVLFDRTGHRAKLTPAGRLLVERGRDLLTATSQLVEDARATACGWEQRLTIAIDGVYPEQSLLPLVARFFEVQAAAAANTDIRIIGEVLSGPWDALESGRADIAIGSEQVSLAKSFRRRKLGGVQFIYVAAPQHPIFQADPTTLDPENYRGVAIADSARTRAPRTVRLGKHQPTLTVGTFAAKIAALEAGLGIGTLPALLARDALARGTLRALPRGPAVDNATLEKAEISLAWQVEPNGRAKRWFLQKLPEFFAQLERAGEAEN